MTLTDWLALLQGVLQFPGQLLALIHILQKTPEQEHQALLARIQAEASQFSQTGRPPS